MQNKINSTIVASAGLFITLSATLAVGLLGLLFNGLSSPENPFHRVISNTSAIVSLAVFTALIGLLSKRRSLQIVGGMVIFLSALHSLLVGLQVDKAFNWPWMQLLDSYFYPPVAIIFLVLGITVLLRSQLQQAIDNEQLQLYYQPIFNLQTNHVVGVEALMRWQRSDGSFISPAEFIPLAESTGQIIPASTWALKQACSDLQRLQQFGSLKMAVNLSALQFNRADFYDSVINTVAAFQIPPNLLELELTESILMDDMSHAISVLQRFRDAHITICIDDFGTGFSSLSYLQRLPVQKLKIDRAFVDDLDKHASSFSIVQGIVAMADQLSITAVAEGVETEQQAAAMRAMGCPLAQGFLFARPMPMAELKAFLMKQQND